ncbi:S8/S53 family peptidase [Roseomonas sp. PWR1]|uniref:S8/S53 family peptidase n=1 Tax=Roseomonas nitratireducens TaxID=2820810 RepID=A0ABS4ATA9_9PROT|nr:S8/S53 family peptidase [Neoroseomonas nitratireducens]MBP0464599.1 S8/S53 family peptidase [Neoroseomonas nitratireducens]
MSDQDGPRLVLLMENTPDLRRAYAAWSLESVANVLKSMLADGLERAGLQGQRRLASEFEVVALPSNVTPPEDDDVDVEEWTQDVVIGLRMTGGERSAEELVASVPLAFGAEATIGADLPVAAYAADGLWTHWCPSEAADPLFGDRAAALHAMKASPGDLAGLPLPGGEAVTIAMVDTGLPEEMLPPKGQMRGWKVLVDPNDPASISRHPGEPLTPHGAMVARNARALAPANRVRLLDCPVIPDGIVDLPVFLHSVLEALRGIRVTLRRQRRREEQAQRPRAGFVLCNAWGVFDPTKEFSGKPYSSDPTHPVSRVLARIAALDADIVFAAGNCGPFCPAPRCHPEFTGPGRGINGANALPFVLTVGAVRSDGTWLGYAGQGPGIQGMAQEKPDLCTPSQFDDGDGWGGSTGTSASTGLAAGAVALLRTRWTATDLTPQALRKALRDAAKQPDGSAGWASRTGHGVMDVAGTAAALPQP